MAYIIEKTYQVGKELVWSSTHNHNGLAYYITNLSPVTKFERLMEAQQVMYRSMIKWVGVRFRILDDSHDPPMVVYENAMTEAELNELCPQEEKSEEQPNETFNQEEKRGEENGRQESKKGGEEDGRQESTKRQSDRLRNRTRKK